MALSGTNADIQTWLKNQSTDVAVAIAARSALRKLPLIMVYQRDRPARSFFRTRALPVFRAGAVAWVAGNLPICRSDLLQAASAAADQVRDAYYAAGATADAAFAAAYQAALYAADRSSTANSKIDERITWQAYADGYHDADRATFVDIAAIEAVRAQPDRNRQALRMMAQEPLWPAGASKPVLLNWDRLKGALAETGDHWEVWTSWYEERLASSPADLELEFARASIPDVYWRHGPGAVNTRIRELLDEYGVPEPIPVQGTGPHFGLSEEFRIALGKHRRNSPAAGLYGIESACRWG